WHYFTLSSHFAVKTLAELDRCDTSSVCSSASTAFDEGGSADVSFNGDAVILESPSSPQRRKSDPSIWPSASRNQKSLEGKTDVWHRIGDNFNSCYKNIVEAFAETNEDLHYQNVEPQKLSAHALRRDIRRCLSSSRAYIAACAALHDLLIWESPLTSLMALFVGDAYHYSSLLVIDIYAHMFYHGYLWMSFLGIILLQLFFNYLSTQRGINLGLYFAPQREVTMPRLELSGVNLVFDVARRAQLVLEFFADLMEKLNNLFMWKRPDTTKKFCIFVGFFFTMSVFCSTSTCFFIIGLIVGLKAFITAYLYHRFPRLRNKLDVFSYFFFRVPNNLEKSMHLPAPRVKITKASSSDASDSQLKTSCSLRNIDIMSSVVDTALLHTRKRSFTTGNILADDAVQNDLTKSNKECTYKSLSVKDLQSSSARLTLSQSIEDEAPPVECIMERSCMLIDKNRTLAKRLLHGTLLLTETEMLFQHNHGDADTKDIIYMPFDEMQKIIKTHSLTPIPGRAIEVLLESRKRPLIFVGISKRDEFFEAIIKAAAEAGVKLTS
uniref:GRAM domain-containing protein 4 n=1 Tax=Ascaris lumbricoides TaxID=6252 RepID=A0A0M3I5H5_ASCLU